MSKHKHQEKQLKKRVQSIVASAIFLHDKSKSDHTYLFDVDDMSDIAKKITTDIVEELS